MMKGRNHSPLQASSPDVCFNVRPLLCLLLCLYRLRSWARTVCCLLAPCERTSSTAWRTPPTRRCTRPPSGPAPTSSSWSCRAATTQVGRANAACRNEPSRGVLHTGAGYFLELLWLLLCVCPRLISYSAAPNCVTCGVASGLYVYRLLHLVKINTVDQRSPTFLRTIFSLTSQCVR